MQPKQFEYEITQQLPSPSIHHSRHSQTTNFISKLSFDGLKDKHFYAYGVGHFFNDLTASYWFNFAIFYLVTVVGTSAAGFAFLMGQLTDAIMMPIAGYACDNFKTRLGQRIFWYAVGFTICVFAFPMLFRNIKSNETSVNMEYLYYGAFASLFNIGWAFGQISHLSLVPVLSCSNSRRERLNNLRNTFTFVANFLLLAILSLIFTIVPDYTLYYFEIAVLVVAIGSITSLFFLWTINETQLTLACQQRRANLISQLPEDYRTQQQQSRTNFKWSIWLKNYRFYLFGLAYICSRLSVNMMATLLPFFIKVKGSSQYTTYIIMILYACSIATSAKTRNVSVNIGRNKTLAIGVGFSVAASAILSLNSGSQAVFSLVIAASFIGVSQAIIMNSVINFICEVIGARSQRGASVFGMYSFVDKIVTGVAVYLVTLPKTIEDTASLERIVLLVPPSLGIMSCFWVFLTRPKNKLTVMSEQPTELNIKVKKIMDELVI